MWDDITVNVSVPTVSGASCRMLKFMHGSSTGTAASPCRVQTLVEQGQGQGLTYLLTNTCQNTLNHVRRWRFTTPHHNTYVRDRHIHCQFSEFVFIAQDKKRTTFVATRHDFWAQNLKMLFRPGLRPDPAAPMGELKRFP